MKRVLSGCVILIVCGGCHRSASTDANDITNADCLDLALPSSWLPCVLGDQVEAEKLILEMEPLSFSATNPPLTGTLCAYTKSLSGMPAVWNGGWNIYIVTKRTYIEHKWVLRLDRARAGTEQEGDVAYLVWHAH